MASSKTLKPPPGVCRATASKSDQLGGPISSNHTFDLHQLQVAKLAATFRLPVTTAAVVAGLAFGEVR